MELIKLTHDNIDQEHICCAISSNKDVQVMSKKAWLKERLDEGLVFLKGNVRGKCFIEYILTEYASKAKGKKGLVILSSKKKLGFLSDPGYMRHRGFVTADKAEPYFELLYLPFMKGAERPRFRDTVREHDAMPQGFVLYYTSQCPFTAKYVPVLERMAKERNAVFQIVHIQTMEEAQNAPSPFTTFSLFYDGQLVTHEILSEKKFDKILTEKGL